MSIQVWSIGLQKLTKMTENNVHIRSTDHFKQVGVSGKMTEMKPIVWMTTVFGCAPAQPSPHQSVKFWNCPLELIFVNSFSLFVGCGSISTRALPNMSWTRLSVFRL